jgi:hypothetical protein
LAYRSASTSASCSTTAADPCHRAWCASTASSKHRPHRKDHGEFSGMGKHRNITQFDGISLTEQSSWDVEQVVVRF